MQMNLLWQNGGLLLICLIVIDGCVVCVNGCLLLYLLIVIDIVGVVLFGVDGSSEIIIVIVIGCLFVQQQVQDVDGLVVVVLVYCIQIVLGVSCLVVVVFLFGIVVVVVDGMLLLVFVLVLGDVLCDLDVVYGMFVNCVVVDWQVCLGQVGLCLFDLLLVDMLCVQVVYMLINQIGFVMQFGLCNYNCFFICDGMVILAVLLCMGEVGVVCDYLVWYSDYGVYFNGLVLLIFNVDGSVNMGFGLDIEYDSQGQYVVLVVDVVCFDGGFELVCVYLFKVKVVLCFLQELCECILVLGYMVGQLVLECFVGIFVLLISYEGYFLFIYSYWDDYWGLKGWYDGVWLVELLGDYDIVVWVCVQYIVLYDVLVVLICVMMVWKGIDFIFFLVDFGDGDFIGVLIVLDLIGVQDVLLCMVLCIIFVCYLDDVCRCNQFGVLYVYMFYEICNVFSYVYFDQFVVVEELLQGLLCDCCLLEWQVLVEVVYLWQWFLCYLGDMLYIWIGVEYGCMLFGMLMCEDDDVLLLLFGILLVWVVGEGFVIDCLFIVYGILQLQVWQCDGVLCFIFGFGLCGDIVVCVWWLMCMCLIYVCVDGCMVSDYDVNGVCLQQLFCIFEVCWQMWQCCVVCGCCVVFLLVNLFLFDCCRWFFGDVIDYV